MIGLGTGTIALEEVVKVECPELRSKFASRRVRNKKIIIIHGIFTNFEVKYFAFVRPLLANLDTYPIQ